MNINQVTGNSSNFPASAANDEARPAAKVNTQISSTTQSKVNQGAISTEEAPFRQELTEAEVNKTVEQLSQVMNANNDVNFKIDKESGRMVIQVIDRETNTLIRQIPSKEIIEISKALEGKTGVLLKDQA